MTRDFSFASTPRLYFGAGKISSLPSLVQSFGKNVLLITGSYSFNTHYGDKILQQLHSRDFILARYAVRKEPTPLMIDEGVREFIEFNPNVVVAVGGGSVLDAGKAISAMLPITEPVKHYLEGVGSKKHPGSKVPFVAVPTTSGTGSEATKNAVLSEIGEAGFKKSLRHDNFVPDVALVDPLLMVSCPPTITAASGMDAFTQLLESYLSTGASPISDALALKGLQHTAKSLLASYNDGENVDARTDMALAAYLSGITLANAGLGVVHGFASSIGGFYDIAHGLICSSLMASANRVTVRKLREQGSGEGALKKYATAGKLFTEQTGKTDEYYIDVLLNKISEWTVEMRIPILLDSGVNKNDFAKIIKATDNKNNPVGLNEEELLEVLEAAQRR
jgi:alcohol dehydrogenase class IV